MLGLPDGVTACLFDMDGVVTRTAVVHNAAWKEMFDDYLRQRSAQTGKEFVPFDPVRDYDEYVDGKPRLEGTSSFLESRGISLPTGSVSDPPGTHTVHGLSNRKNDLILAVLERDGVQVYPGSNRYIAAVRAARSEEHTSELQSRENLVCRLLLEKKKKKKKTEVDERKKKKKKKKRKKQINK